MITAIERYRQPFSWLYGIILAGLIFFSPPAGAETLLDEGAEMVGYTLLVLAALGRIWCSIYIVGRKDEELCTDGPYSLVRNPLYAFSLLGLIGILCGARRLLMLPIAVPVFAGYYALVIRAEEQRLTRLFGKRYAAYRARTRAIIPRRLSGYTSRVLVTLNPRSVMRAVVDASWFLWLIVLLEFVERLKTAP